MDGALRIAIFTDTYLPSRNGVAVSVATFAQELQRQGDEVLIVAPRNGEEEGGSVLRTPSFHWKGAPDYPLAVPWRWGLEKRLRAFRPSLIHAQSPNLLGRVGGWMARRLGCPLVYTYHTLLHEYARFYSPLLQERMACLFLEVGRRFARKADAVIAPSASVACWLEHLGVGREVHVVPTGVRPPAEWPDRQRERCQRGWDDGEVVLLFVGRLAHEKNVEFLLRGFRRALERLPSLRLVLVGDGKAAEGYRRLAQALGVTHRTTFVGSVPHERIWGFYAAADVYVSASLTETQGLAISEALWAGLPCVVVEAYGAAEWVRHGERGFTTPLDEEAWAQAIVVLARNAPLRREMGRRAAAFARGAFDPQRCAQRLRSVYEEVLRRCRR